MSLGEPTILVTGSMPFAGLADSPSTRLVRQMRMEPPAGMRLVCREMPVSYARLPGLIRGMAREIAPDAVLCLGLSLGAPVLKVETRAINWADFRVADEEGARPGGVPLDPDGPAGRVATWPAARLVTRLRAAGIPAAISHHAGSHLCNLTLYEFLGCLPPGVPCGFLHLPLLPEQVAQMMLQRSGQAETAPIPSLDLPSMEFALIRRAAGIALEVLRDATSRGDVPDGNG